MLLQANTIWEHIDSGFMQAVGGFVVVFITIHLYLHTKNSKRISGLQNALKIEKEKRDEQETIRLEEMESMINRNIQQEQVNSSDIQKLTHSINNVQQILTTFSEDVHEIMADWNDMKLTFQDIKNVQTTMLDIVVDHKRELKDHNNRILTLEIEHRNHHKQGKI